MSKQTQRAAKLTQNAQSGSVSEPDDAPFDMSPAACKRRLKQRKPMNGFGDDDEFDILARHRQKRRKIEFSIED